MGLKLRVGIVVEFVDRQVSNFAIKRYRKTKNFAKTSNLFILSSGRVF